MQDPISLGHNGNTDYSNNSALSTTNFTFAVFSDPQAWRLENGDPNSWNKNGKEWTERNTDVKNALQNEPIDFAITNGDLTDYDHRDEWNSFDELYTGLTNNKTGKTIPNFIGLGNHNYDNNFGDCWFDTTHYSEWGSQGCFVHSLDNIETIVKAYRDYDYDIDNVNFNMSTYTSGVYLLIVR